MFNGLGGNIIMAWDDLFVEIYYEMEELKLREEFDAQLKMMQDQPKHKYKETKDRWSYARDKVIKANKEKKQ